MGCVPSKPLESTKEKSSKQIEQADKSESMKPDAKPKEEKKNDILEEIAKNNGEDVVKNKGSSAKAEEPKLEEAKGLILYTKEEISKTTILDRLEIVKIEKIYDANEKAKCNIDILEKKSIYKITLKEGRPVVLKTITIIEDPEDEKKAHCVLREFYIGSIIKQMTSHVIKSMGMNEAKIDSERMMRYEILMEYGDLTFGALQLSKKDNDAVKYGYQLLSVLDLISDKGIAHLDIKPDNILFCGDDKELKLIDFGISVSFCRTPERLQGPIQEYLDRISGYSEFYSPPEMLNCKTSRFQESSIILEKMDIFSFGVTFAEFLMKEGGLARDILKRDTVELHNEYLKKLNEQLTSIGQKKWIPIIFKCLCYEACDRPSFKAIRNEYEGLLIELGLKAFIDKEQLTAKDFDYKKLADEQRKANQYEGAVLNYEKCLSINEKMSEADISLVYKNLGSCYLDLGDYQKAIEKGTIAEKIAIKVYGEFHETVGYIYNSLGLAYKSVGEYAKAMEYHTKSQIVLIKVHGEEHPDVSFTYGNMGIISDSLGDYAKAREYYTKSLNIKIKATGENSLSVSYGYNNVGSIYEAFGDYKKAIEYSTKAMEIREKLLGPQHPKTANAYFFLSSAFCRLGDYKAAAEYATKALTAKIKKFGEDHPDLVKPMCTRATIYAALGNYNKAIEYCAKAEKICINLVGEDNLTTAYCYKASGSVYGLQGNFDKALEYCMRAERFIAKQFGVQHPELVQIYNDIGAAYTGLGDYEKAIEYCTKAETIHSKVFGVEHPYTAKVYNNMGEVYNASGEYSKAAEYFTKAEAIRNKAFGGSHPDSARTCLNLGLAYRSLGDNKKALECCSRSEAICKKQLCEEHPMLATVYCGMGEAYFALGDCRKAIECGEMGLKIQSTHTAKLYENLSAWCDKAGEKVKAKEYASKKSG